MKFSVFQLSRQGGRAVNEDRMGYSYTHNAVLLMLADGMGGHAQGEVAAQMALQSMAAQFQAQARPQLEDVPGFLITALLNAHRDIVQYAQARQMPDYPRTTMVAAVIQDGHITWVHCGDSRLYWAREGALLRRTHDHSFAEMARTGKLSESDPRLKNRNVLFTCLGSLQRPVFDMEGPHPLRAGDRVLLCSDGLWDVMSEATLLQRLANARLESAVTNLVETALAAAGKLSDNVTALVLEWLQPADPLDTAPDAVRDVAGAGALERPQPTSRGAVDSAAVAAAPAQLSPAQQPVGALPEEVDVERAIQEMNEALRRSTKFST